MTLKFKKILNKLIEKKDLTYNEAEYSFKKIMSGTLSNIEVTAFLISISTKGESILEIIAAAKVLKKKSKKMKLFGEILDTCGTGGDGMNTLNISTATALLASACGLKVAKHGNRAVSSRSGSSDVFSKLGININADKSKVEKCFKENGICFLMAPLYHTAMKNVAEIRSTLKIKTIFNILGPLINPARANYQLIGVYSKKWLLPIANCIKELSVSKAWIVHGEDGLDEITTTGKTYVVEVDKKRIKRFVISPKKLGFKQSKISNLKGKNSSYNAKAIKDLFSNKNFNPYFKDIVLLNTAACLVITNKCKTLKEGIVVANNCLKNKTALYKLKKFARDTQ